ncbi:nucleoside-diphosphate-sugar epimerase [Pedobacter cryoconitis]|uniref:Nucleoside-diphosphate-sugar epimerase n=1 Tax=Pedobacter cryoconitis TaxID=188932 RepID=A0A7W9E0X3_9SPHI|nr:NAD-dependent epimerase/dehydratase family protein [Pedobacter cryoconitis]MBB5638887.1 nucleoside-diphosphate-sugar epimerase [Pedobacter cryoconitis]
MKVLVTGSCGHLGEAIIRLLIDRNIEYSGLDLKSSKYTTHVGSLTDRHFVKDCVKGVKAIIHTALYISRILQQIVKLILLKQIY